MQMQMHYSLGNVYGVRRGKVYTLQDRHNVFCIGKMQFLIRVSLILWVRQGPDYNIRAHPPGTKKKYSASEFNFPMQK
jgi:hypothetical protein